MNWLQTIIYALISGMAEFLPVSSRAHQTVMLTLFGEAGIPAAQNFTIHLGALTAVYINCQNHLSALTRTQRLLTVPPKRRKRQIDPELKSELHIFRSASVWGAVLLLSAAVWLDVNLNLNLIALLLLVNGIILYITCRVATGNKNAISMNRFDSMLLGLVSGLGVFSGLSRLGLGVSVMIIRGASPKNAFNWCLLISIPLLCALCIADVVMMFAVGVVGFGFVLLLKCLVAAVFSYIGSTVAISLLRFMAVKIGFSVFSYYCWGMAFLSFLLYMV